MNSSRLPNFASTTVLAAALPIAFFATEMRRPPPPIVAEHHGDDGRIDGPHVWIEFACQDGIVFRKIHSHTVWRDRRTDYGVSYAL